MNSYYLVTLPNAASLGRLQAFMAFTKIGISNARELLHTRFSNDGTKVIVQGDISADLVTHLTGKPFIEYLGDCLPSGQADEAVHSFIAQNSADWEI